MSRLSRFTQKIFGSGAGPNQIAKFGSLFAGTSAFTTDPGQAMSLSNWLTGWLGAAIGGNSPAIEDMNAVCYVLAYQLAYLMQAGVPEWDSGTTYFTSNIVSSSGALYVSRTDDNIANAVTDPANWTKIGGQILTALGDIIYGGVNGSQTRLPGNQTTTLQVYTSVGDGLGSSSAPALRDFKAPVITKYLSGSGNFTTSAGVMYLRIRMVGGGAGGSGAGAGAAVGGDGADTTFGLCTAGKGLGGNNASGQGGVGGAATLGVGYTGIALPGGAGGVGGGQVTGSSFLLPAGIGGSSAFGGAGSGGYSGNTGQNAGANTGSGGGGGGTGLTGVTGMGGGSGAFLDVIFTPTAGQVFAYSVGAKGNGGAGGSGGQAGGNGGEGMIEVTEYFQ